MTTMNHGLWTTHLNPTTLLNAKSSIGKALCGVVRTTIDVKQQSADNNQMISSSLLQQSCLSKIGALSSICC